MRPPEPRFLDDRPTYWAEHKPDGEAVSYLGRSWTWAQWNDRIQRLAGALVERGIRRGDVVAFLDKNHPACIELTQAASSIGAATAVINFRLAADEMDYVLNDSGAKLLIVGTELIGAIDKIRDELTYVEDVIEVTPDGTDGDQYEALLAAATPVGRPADVDPEDTCLIMYSSGTTGRPKGVVLSQRNILAHTMNAATFEFGPDDKNMVAMPLFHVGGSAYVQYGIHAGIPTIMTREADGASLAGALLQGANRTFLVPAVLGKVLESGEDAVKLFSQLRTFVYGASPMPPALLKSALKVWPDTDFIQVYGLTEVCGAITQLAPEVHRDDSRPERLISAGQPSREVEVRVVDPETLAEMPTGSPGELWFRTPQLMKGYHNKPEVTASAITEDGWFRSGDIGRVDEDGFIFVEDRLKDMIISGGENIYSVEVERVLTDHPAVLDAAVFGIPDDKWGESVNAVVELSVGGETSGAELVAWCRERLAHYKCPRSVEISEALPRNPTGKLLKRDLRAPYWENHGRAI
jgi:acyl-CoA synthetase (AMP-forming)/AMP-acid ligase II